jgi:hypothetical protein
MVGRSSRILEVLADGEIGSNFAHLQFKDGPGQFSRLVIDTTFSLTRLSLHMVLCLLKPDALEYGRLAQLLSEEDELLC